MIADLKVGQSGHAGLHAAIRSRLLSVREFGTVGGNDDTRIIQMAIDSGKCLLDSGSYKTLGTLRITTSNTIVDGGIGATINYSGSGNAIEIIGTAGAEVLYPKIKNLSLIGSPGSRVGIYGELFGRSWFQNVSVSHFDSDGIKLTNGWAPLFDYCQVEDIGEDGIRLEAGINHAMHLPVLNNCVVNRVIGNAFSCLQDDISSGVLILAGTFEGSGIGILLDGGRSHAVVKAHFEDNQIADMQIGKTKTTYGTKIESCYFLNYAWSRCIGINLVKHNNTVIETPFIDGRTTGIQIDLVDTNRNVNIVRPTITNCTNEMLVDGLAALCDGKIINYEDALP